MMTDRVPLSGFGDVPRGGQVWLSCLLLCLCIGTWEIVDALGPRGVPYAGRLFSIIFFVEVLAVMLLLLQRRPRILRFGIIWAYAIMLIGLIAIVNYQIVDWPRSQRHVASDVATVLFISILITHISLLKAVAFSNWVFIVINILLVIAAIIAPIAAYLVILPDYFWFYRFDQPHYLLMSSVLALIFFSPRFRVPAIIAFVALMTLTMYSGNRSSILTILLIVSIWGASSVRYSYLAFVPLCAVLAVLLFQAVDLTEQGFRVFQSSSVISDESLLQRLYEIRDVVSNVTRESNLYSIFFGHGAGAMWQLDTTSPNGRDVEFGRVHYIHITLVSVWFRYGIVPAAILAYVYLFIAKDVILYIFTKDAIFRDIKFNILFFSAISFLVYSLFRSPFYDAISVFTILMYIFYRKIYRHGA